MSVRTTATDEYDSQESIAGNDQRAVWIELTPRGKPLVEITVEALLRHQDALLAELGDEEIAVLSNFLRRLLGLLEKR